MSSSLIAVAPDASLGRAARIMDEGHIHRLLVLSEKGVGAVAATGRDTVHKRHRARGCESRVISGVHRSSSRVACLLTHHHEDMRSRIFRTGCTSTRPHETILSDLVSYV